MFRVIRFDVIRVIKVCNSRCDTYSNYLKLPYYQEKKTNDDRFGLFQSSTFSPSFVFDFRENSVKFITSESFAWNVGPRRRNLSSTCCQTKRMMEPTLDPPDWAIQFP